MKVKALEVFEYLEEKDLIFLAQVYPKQLLNMCILLSLDYQLEIEQKIKSKNYD